MWLLHGLKDDYDVALITTREIDLKELNAAYGTSVAADDISVRVAPVPGFMRRSSNIAALRGAFYTRFARHVGKDYDLCLSSYSLSDWGRPGIHFIADFVWDPRLREQFSPTPPKGSKLIHRDTPWRQLYLFMCSQIRGKRRERASFFDGSETIVANSNWSAGIIAEAYGYRPKHILYPPVSTSFPLLPWERRSPGFVSIGRIAQEKRILEQVDILSRVRARGHDIHLHLIGAIPDDPYGRSVRALCARHRDWICVEGEQFGANKVRLLSQHRYAIHTCTHEAFGIAVAELVKAGCLAFVPDTGGQVEIVTPAELQFHDVDHAVEVISQALDDEAGQAKLRGMLASSADQFSAEAFCQGARRIIAEHIAEP